MELLEKYLTWFTPLVSSIAAIIFAAEKQIDEGPGAGNTFSRIFMPATTLRYLKNLNVKENYRLVSSCQAASCPPCKKVKISTQKQIYNIWQDRY